MEEQKILVQTKETAHYIRKNTPWLKFLLRYADNYHDPEGYCFASPLHHAIKTADDDGIEILLEAGIDPDTDTYRGGSAIMFAVEIGYTKAVELLLQYGATTSKHELLEQATRRDFCTIARIIIQNMTDDEIQDSEKMKESIFNCCSDKTQLYVADDCDSYDFLTAEDVDRYHDYNAQDVPDDVKEYGHYCTAHWLIQRGADFDILDDDNNSPFDNITDERIREQLREEYNLVKNER